MNIPETPLLSPDLLKPNLNREAIESWALDTITKLLDSEPTMGIMEDIKRIQTAISVMEAQVKDRLKTEYANQPGRYRGIQLAFTNGKRQFDYSRDPIWNKLRKELTERETFLKGLKEPTDIFDESTGEIIRAYPPSITYGKDSISVTLH